MQNDEIDRICLNENGHSRCIHCFRKWFSGRMLLCNHKFLVLICRGWSIICVTRCRVARSYLRFFFFYMRTAEHKESDKCKIFITLKRAALKYDSLSEFYTTLIFLFLTYSSFSCTSDFSCSLSEDGGFGGAAVNWERIIFRGFSDADVHWPRDFSINL